MATQKRTVFIAEYLKCFNATEAARRAGYAHPNKRGPELVVNSGIKAQIDAVLQEKLMSADEALSRMAEIARGDWTEYVNVDEVGRIGINIAALKEDGKIHLLKGITPTSTGRKYEFYDSQAALNTILKAGGVFVEKHEHSGEVTNIIQVVGADPEDL